MGKENFVLIFDINIVMRKLIEVECFINIVDRFIILFRDNSLYYFIIDLKYNG